MSVCRVVSCVVGRGCFLWPMCSLGKTLLAFALLNFVVKDQICLLLQVSLDFLLLHSSSLWWKGHFHHTLLGGISSRSSCRCLQNHWTSVSSALVIGAQNWITVKLNSLPWKQTENIVILQAALKNHISKSYVDYEGYSISSKGFLPTEVGIMVTWI